MCEKVGVGQKGVRLEESYSGEVSCGLRPATEASPGFEQAMVELRAAEDRTELQLGTWTAAGEQRYEAIRRERKGAGRGNGGGLGRRRAGSGTWERWRGTRWEGGAAPSWSC